MAPKTVAGPGIRVSLLEADGLAVGERPSGLCTEVRKMTKKDFEMVAKVLKGLKEEEGMFEGVLGEVARRLAAKIAEDNPRFDVGKFLSACAGVEGKR
jgi:hypothetical protein